MKQLKISGKVTFLKFILFSWIGSFLFGGVAFAEVGQIPPLSNNSNPFPITTPPEFNDLNGLGPIRPLTTLSTPIPPSPNTHLGFLNAQIDILSIQLGFDETPQPPISPGDQVATCIFQYQHIPVCESITDRVACNKKLDCRWVRSQYKVRDFNTTYENPSYATTFAQSTCESRFRAHGISFRSQTRKAKGRRNGSGSKKFGWSTATAQGWDPHPSLRACSGTRKKISPLAANDQGLLRCEEGSTFLSYTVRSHSGQLDHFSRYKRILENSLGGSCKTFLFQDHSCSGAADPKLFYDRIVNRMKLTMERYPAGTRIVFRANQGCSNSEYVPYYQFVFEVSGEKTAEAQEFGPRICYPAENIYNCRPGKDYRSYRCYDPDEEEIVQKDCMCKDKIIKTSRMKKIVRKRCKWNTPDEEDTEESM